MTVGVEESYSGPRWDEGELTAEFMDSLLEWLKDEKRLHRKYAYKVGSGMVGWSYQVYRLPLPPPPSLSPSPSPSLSLLSSLDITPIQADL